MALTLLSADLVNRLLPPMDAIGVVEGAMRALSGGDVSTPERIIAPLADGAGWLAVMPASASRPSAYGAKVVSLVPGNPARGWPAVQGVVLLFDAETGTPACVVDGAALTGLRTAAASGLATRLLARPEAVSHGLFGSGALVPLHIDAIAAARPAVQTVLIWARDPEKARRLAAAEAARLGLDIRAVTDPEEAAACDIVTTLTGATDPILHGAWIGPGTHINLVGAHRPDHREADTATVAKARLFVDSRAGALSEAGDILLPIAEGAFSEDHIVAEIGEVSLGAATGRIAPGDVTLYKSLGVAAQDLYAAAEVWRRAVDQGLGIRAEL